MDEIDKAYKGREHSAVKHELLKGYLKKLLLIRGVTGCKELTYVDCFAGPWGDESDDLHATSIAISLKVLTEIHAFFATERGIDLKLKAIYVEKGKKQYTRLKKYLETNCPECIESYPIHGDYSEKVDEILGYCEGSFAFFFIDPKQWTPVGIPRLTKLLARKNSEFLITFMYEFLNRFLGKEDLRQQVSAMLGPLGSGDIDMLSEMDSKTRENTIVRKYRDALKANMVCPTGRKPRAYHATVLHKDHEKTKYHLVYLTCHPLGIVEFSAISEKSDIFQRKVRFQKAQERTGQKDMFGIDEQTARELDAADQEDVKAYWLERLDGVERRFTVEDLADMLEETGWLETDFQECFRELAQEKKAENVDAKSHRPKRIIHFDKGERLRRLV